MKHVRTWLLSSLSLAAPLVLGAGQAFAAPCPPPGLAACPGRNVGDLILAASYPPDVLGVSSQTGQIYEFLQGATPAGFITFNQIMVEPANPMRSLIIGSVDNGELGVVELDECGNIVSTSPVWGTFANLPPGTTLSSMNNHSLAVDPLTGLIVSPGANGFLEAFPTTGGQDLLIPMSTAIDYSVDFVRSAFDASGNLFGVPFGGSIVRFPAATLSTPPLVGTVLPETTFMDPAGMVADAQGNLFTLETDGVWKVDPTGHPTFLSPYSEGMDGYAITIDASGNLWILQYAPTIEETALLEISSVTGEENDGLLINFFPEALSSIAIYGTNLPAVQATCQNRAPCDVGGVAVGACAGAGLVDPSSGLCVAPPGIPSSDFHTQPAPNGSWDWDCDGTKTLEFTNLSTVAPRNVCGGTATTCNGSANIFSSANPACGTTFSEIWETCHWTAVTSPPRVGQGCSGSSGSSTRQQGCH